MFSPVVLQISGKLIVENGIYKWPENAHINELISTMSLDLADLKLLSTIARHLNFRAAAQELGLSASAISHAVRSLEERLGVRMFSRTTRSVALTPAGRQLLDRVGPPLQDIAAAIDDINVFRDTPQGLLRINAPRSAGDLVLGPLIAQFLAQHPQAEVELVLDDGLVDIVEGGFDAGVRYGERLQQDMVALPLGPQQQLMVVASPALLAGVGAPRNPRDLMQMPCVRPPLSRRPPPAPPRGVLGAGGGGPAARGAGGGRAPRPPDARCTQASLNGSSRGVLPVSWAMAFANAGASGGNPGSPMPFGGSALGTMCTVTWGMSVMRGTAKSPKLLCSTTPSFSVMAPPGRHIDRPISAAPCTWASTLLGLTTRLQCTPAVMLCSLGVPSLTDASTT